MRGLGGKTCHTSTLYVAAWFISSQLSVLVWYEVIFFFFVSAHSVEFVKLSIIPSKKKIPSYHHHHHDTCLLSDSIRISLE